MRTNIVIDDKLMADVMASGDFKTKREAVEEGLRMLKRKKAYAAIRAARGTLFWDDSDEAWAKRRAEIAQEGPASTISATVQEPAAPYTPGKQP
jgi:antitoxin ParD1/3/4